MQFTSGGLEANSHAEDLDKKSTYPRREEFQWRPNSVLCKRFDLIDPFMGKPPPPPRMRHKMDSFVFTSASGKATMLEGNIPSNRDQGSVPLTDTEEMSKHIANSEKEVEVETENVERPVDLYKAIFSDDEVEATTTNRKEDAEKKVEVAHTALNRLIAGDFLESLGKELGLEVPPDRLNKTGTSASKKSAVGDPNILPGETKSSAVDSLTNRNGDVYQQEIAKGSETRKVESGIGNLLPGSSRYVDSGPTNTRSSKTDLEKVTREDSKSKSPRTHYRKQSSSSSEDERSRNALAGIDIIVAIHIVIHRMMIEGGNIRSKSRRKEK